MRKLSHQLRHPGRIMVAVPALALALALGAALTAPAASASVAACSWQPLTLVNGWQSEQSAWGTGDPSVCVMGNHMVYLSGSLAQPASGSSEFAVLPADAWPASNVYLNVYTDGDTVGVLRIEPDGSMLAYDGAAQGFTSLAGVSYLAAGAAESPLSLLNGWQSAQPAWDTGGPAYFASDGVVHLTGSIGGSGQASGNFADLPAAVLPVQCVQTAAYTFGGTPGAVQVQPDTGELNAWYGNGTEFTSLAGISYLDAPAAWQQLTLLNGWDAMLDDCVNPKVSYEVNDGVVYLDGYLVSSGGPAEFAVLPPGARPAHTLYLAVNAFGLTADLVISPSGAMYLYPAAGYPDSEISLGAISYKTGS